MMHNENIFRNNLDIIGGQVFSTNIDDVISANTDLLHFCESDSGEINLYREEKEKKNYYHSQKNPMEEAYSYLKNVISEEVQVLHH